MATQKAVLIVEDEKPLAHALDLKLNKVGFKAYVATNGAECMNIVKTKHIDVVLLDMMMPVMDGFQVLTEMSKLPDRPKVFALSNLSLHDDQTRVLGMGADKYFIKADTPLSVIVDEIVKA